MNQAPRRAFITYTDLPFLNDREVLLSFDSESPRLDPSAPLSELDIALGTTIGGVEDLKPRIPEARWAWMKEEGKILGPASDLSIKRPDVEAKGQLLDHCAETLEGKIHASFTEDFLIDQHRSKGHWNPHL